MFDANLYIKTITQNSNFQQVCGSLIKTHPDSVFISFYKRSELEFKFFSNCPKIYVTVGYDYYGHVKREEREVTVLQILTNADCYVCEVIVHYKKDDEQFVEKEDIKKKEEE